HFKPRNDTNAHTGRDAPHHTNHELDHTMDQCSDHHVDREAGPLIKQDKTKPNETKQAAAAVLGFYEENFGVAAPFVKKAIVRWLEVSGEELVLYAMERTLESGKATWAYTKGI